MSIHPSIYLDFVGKLEPIPVYLNWEAGLHAGQVSNLTEG